MGPLLGLRLTASRHLLRLGPAWAVVAGAAAAGIRVDGAVLLPLVGAVVIADAAWGAVWLPLAGATPALAAEHATAPGASSGDGARREQDAAAPEGWRLPYLQAGSPAARLGGALPQNAWHSICAGALLALGLGWLLGVPALLLSGVVLVLCGLLLYLALWGVHSALLHALLQVGLPWALGMTCAQPAGRLEILAAAGVIGGAFTVLDWAVQRMVWSVAPGPVGVWFGQAVVVAALAALHLPWTTAAVAALFVAPALMA